MLEKVTRRLEKVLYPVTTAVSVIGMLSLIGMVLLTVSEVIARRFFNAPITGVMSMSSLGLVIFTFMTLAYCASQRAHVELEVLTNVFPKRVQAGLATVIYFVTAGILGVAAWQLWLQAMKIHAQTYGNLEIPIFPFYYIAAAGTFLLALVYLVLSLKAVQGGGK